MLGSSGLQLLILETDQSGQRLQQTDRGKNRFGERINVVVVHDLEREREREREREEER